MCGSNMLRRDNHASESHPTPATVLLPSPLASTSSPRAICLDAGRRARLRGLGPIKTSEFKPAYWES
jgi:hypothetical protein